LSRSLRDHGASRSDHARHNEKAAFLLAEYNHLGYNFRMTDIQGALGCAQLDRAQWILNARTACARRYDEMLSDLEWLETPVVPDGFRHGYQAYVCLFRPEQPSLKNVADLHEQRNELMMQLEGKGISTRQGTHAPVIQGYYAKKYELLAEQFPNSYIADRLTLTLPLYPQMTEVEQNLVWQSLQAEFKSRAIA
jgi:dTDP-4-amino-4,6-dideoxygalactose transaminase